MYLNLIRNYDEFNIKAVFIINKKYSEKIYGFCDFTEYEGTLPIRKIKKTKETIEFIRKIKPDIIFSVGWSQIIPSEILEIPSKGVIGFHYAKLPERRGGSPITWALIHGLDETFVTMIYYGNKVDAGDIIGEYKIAIDKNDTSKILLGKCEKTVIELSRKYLNKLIEGTAPRIPQDDSRAFFTKRRNDKDDEIHIDKLNPIEIHNFIRALSDPYPGAYIKYKKYKIYLTNSRLIEQKKD